MRFASILIACGLTCAQLVILFGTVQSQPKADNALAKEVMRAVDLLALATSYDLRKVESLLTKVRNGLAKSDVARSRLYYPVSQPRDDYVRFKHLEKLVAALSLHAKEAAENQDFARSHRALDLAIETMLLIATAPVPPSTLNLEEASLPGETAAGQPIFALRSSMFNFSRALQEIISSSSEKVTSALVPAWTASVVTELPLQESSQQRRLKQLIDSKNWREYAQECSRMRADVAKGLVALRKELSTAFGKINR